MKDLRKVVGGKICAEGGATKLIEMGGQLIGKGLSKPVSFRGHQGCAFDDPECWIDGDHHCGDSRVVYEVRCENCRDGTVAKYVGTSGFSTHKRIKEHSNDVKNRRVTNALAKHHSNKHREVAPNFKAKPLRMGVKFNLDRYITEALLIEEAHQDPNVDLLNNRSEWGQRGVPRVRFEV